MKKKIFLLCLWCVTGIQFSGARQNKVSVNTPEAKHVISKHICGHFGEYLGGCIYYGFYVGDSNKVIPNIGGVRNDIVDALNTDEPGKIQPTTLNNASISNTGLQVKLSPFSVVVLTLK